MSYIYQSPMGTGLSAKQWEEQKGSPEWTLKEYKNSKIWVRLHWIGRYKKDLPSEYRHSHGIQVYNRVHVRDSEWHEEGQLTDKGWILDVAATETFRTKSAAESAYDDMLLRYTESELHETDSGDFILVEKGNEFGTKHNTPEEMMFDDDLVDAAADKGINVGGWS